MKLLIITLVAVIVAAAVCGQQLYGEIVYECREARLANRRITAYFGRVSVALITENYVPERMQLAIIQPGTGKCRRIDTAAERAFPCE